MVISPLLGRFTTRPLCNFGNQSSVSKQNRFSGILGPPPRLCAVSCVRLPFFFSFFFSKNRKTWMSFQQFQFQFQQGGFQQQGPEDPLGKRGKHIPYPPASVRELGLFCSKKKKAANRHLSA
jgi:hypothetical protein